MSTQAWKFSFFSKRRLLELARKRYIKFSLGFIGVSTAFATDLIIHLPDTASVSRKSITYQCDGRGPQFGVPGGPFVVEYINGGGNSLAIVPVSGNALVFSNVIAGSGARYPGRAIHMVGVRRFRHAFFRLTGRQNGINLQAGKNEVTVASVAETKL